LWHGSANGINPSPLGVCLLGWKNTLTIFSDCRLWLCEKSQHFGQGFAETLSMSVDSCQSSVRHFLDPDFFFFQSHGIQFYENEYLEKVSTEYLGRQYASAAAFLWAHIFHWLWRWMVIQGLFKGLVLLVSLGCKVIFLTLLLVGGLSAYTILILTSVLGYASLVFGGFWICNLACTLSLSTLVYVTVFFLWMWSLCDNMGKKERQVGSV
jgi:hypothetical protein